jgi:hypothetical protein
MRVFRWKMGQYHVFLLLGAVSILGIVGIKLNTVKDFE